VSARVAGIALLAAVMAVGTWFGGWWALIAAAALWQLIRRQASPWHAGLAALLGWGALLLMIPATPMGRLMERLGGIVRLPSWATVAVTLAYAALLGWSSARLVRAVRSR
jgi:CDP-diglyceride synthetase